MSKSAENGFNAMYNQRLPIVFTDEELEEHRKCVESKRSSNGIFSLLGGIVAFLTVPVKAETPVKMYVKKGFIGTTAMAFISIMSTAQSIVACKPILDKAIKSRLEAGKSSNTQVSEETPGSKDVSDFSLSPSFHDTGSFNFAVDLDSSTGNQDNNESSEDLKQSMAVPKKRVTYDELWRLHRENSQARYKAEDSSSEGISTEFEAGDEPVLPKKKIRTNKYGDPLD